MLKSGHEVWTLSLVEEVGGTCGRSCTSCWREEEKCSIAEPRVSESFCHCSIYCWWCWVSPYVMQLNDIYTVLKNGPLLHFLITWEMWSHIKLIFGTENLQTVFILSVQIVRFYKTWYQLRLHPWQRFVTGQSFLSCTLDLGVISNKADNSWTMESCFLVWYGCVLPVGTLLFLAKNKITDVTVFNQYLAVRLPTVLSPLSRYDMVD